MIYFKQKARVGKKLVIPLFLFLFIFSITLVSAVSPFQQSDSPSGFEIRTAIPEIIERTDGAFDFHVHVFNETTGLPVTNGISCYLHIYDTDGTHLYEGVDSVASHDFDYAWEINEINFTNNIFYPYVAQCNSSTQGGFISYDFAIKDNAKEGIDIVWILIIAIIIASSLILYGFAREEHPPITMGGILLLVIALYIWVNGFGILGATELISRFIAASLFVVGAVLSIKSLSELK